VSGRGVLYLASGAACRAEAALSARSVKAAWPATPVAIITDAPPDGDCFDHVQIVAAEDDNLFKVRHLARSPFERTLMLDSDTYCVEPLPEVFDLLDRFDLAAAHEAGRFATRWEEGREVSIRAPDVPDCVPEFNTGVIAFRREPRVLQLFERWLKLAEEARGACVPHTQDQPTFRRAVYQSDLRVAVLPPEYNFRLIIPGFARGAIKLIHGRWKYRPIGKAPDEVFATLAQTFNENLGPRVFVHAFGMICGHGPFAIAYDDPKRTCELGEIRPMAAARDRAAAERDRSLAEAAQLRAELDLMRRSKSWRITRPLRALRHGFSPR
jgi:hypothetical protein